MKGQFTVYRSFDDVANGTGTVYDGHEFVKGSGKSGFTIRNTSTKEKVEVDFEHVWGFSYKDRFYRIIRYGKYLSKGPKHVAALLYHQSGAFYWLTDWWLEGITNAETTNKRKDQLTILPDAPGYLSATMDGEAMLMSTTYAGGHESYKGGQVFFADHPELDWIDKCGRSGKSGYDYNLIGICMDRQLPEGGK
jgi:hypothetical protein